MAEGWETIDFYQSDCKKPRIQPLDPSHLRPKSKGRRSPKCLHGNTFWPRRQTFEGSLGQIGIETKTMVERPSIFFHKKISKTDKFLVIILERLFWAGNREGCSLFLWTLGLAFGGFTLYPAEGSNSYALLAIFSPFLWTLNKVWPFNPTASRLGRP
jgi:hypothetical protein